MIEIFAPIKGFDNYKVSNLGRVKSLKRFMPMPHGGNYFQDEKVFNF